MTLRRTTVMARLSALAFLLAIAPACRRSSNAAESARPQDQAAQDAGAQKTGPPLEPQIAAKPPKEAKNLILVTLDTTRADYIGCYAGRTDATPHIDGVAKAGVRFENATSESNQTNPSHVSVMTGVMGIEHGILDNDTKLRSKVDSLPAAFQRAGYTTAGFPSAHHVSSWLGWRGFDSIYEVETGHVGQLDAKKVTDRFLDWLSSHKEKPFFVWIHYFDAHSPYVPPQEYVDRFYKGDPRAGTAPLLTDLPNLQEASNNTWIKGVRDPEYPKALYRGEIAYIDDNFGRLLSALDDAGLRDRTGIVITGDHGENLGEHGQYYNHYFIWEPTLRVPFIMSFPWLSSTGRIVKQDVIHLDIAPTVAEIYRLDVQNKLRGVSLAPTLNDKPNKALEGRSEFTYEHGNNKQIAFREGRMKVVFTITKHDKPPILAEPHEVWVYDLSADPGEQNNLVDQYPALAEKYAPMAKRWFDYQETYRNKRSDASPSEIADLNDLGYIEQEAGDEPPPPRKRPVDGAANNNSNDNQRSRGGKKKP